MKIQKYPKIGLFNARSEVWLWRVHGDRLRDEVGNDGDESDDDAVGGKTMEVRLF